MAITVVLASTVLFVVPNGDAIGMPSFGSEDTENDGDAVQTELVRAVEGDAGVADEHRFRIEVEPGSPTAGNSLNQLRVEYPDGVDAGGVTGSDVERVGVDMDGDGVLEADAMVDVDGLSTSDGGSTLTVGFGGNHNLEVGDWIVLDVDDVEDPASPGEYAVSVNVNGDVTRTGTLDVE